MGIIDKLKQVKDIAKAFTQPIPVDEKWFQDRIAHCDPCEWNSDNKNPDDLSFTDKLKIKGPFGGLAMCTACGCNIARKAGLETSECGLKELGQTPLWTAITTFNRQRKSLSLTNLTPEVGVVLSNPEGFVINTGKLPNSVVEFKLRLKDTKGVRVKNIASDCGCTVATTGIVDDNTVDIGFKVSTLRFRKGAPITKNVSVHYFEGKSTRLLTTVIQIKLVKI